MQLNIFLQEATVAKYQEYLNREIKREWGMARRKAGQHTLHGFFRRKF